MQNDNEPKATLQRIAGAYVVTAPLPDGTWVATYPHFLGTGASEREAVLELSANIASAAREVALCAPNEIGAYAGTATHQQIAPTLGAPDELALVWARSEAAAQMFFGAPTDAVVTVIKECPETDEEKRRYAADAKLYGVAYKKNTREFIQATAGVRRTK